MLLLVPTMLPVFRGLINTSFFDNKRPNLSFLIFFLFLRSLKEGEMPKIVEFVEQWVNEKSLQSNCYPTMLKFFYRIECACKHIHFIVRFHAPQCTFIKYIKCRCHSCSIDEKKNCCWICALNCQQKQQFHLADAKHRYRRHLSGWWYAQYAMYQIQAFRHFNAKRAHAHFHYPHSTYY